MRHFLCFHPFRLSFYALDWALCWLIGPYCWVRVGLPSFQELTKLAHIVELLPKHQGWIIELIDVFERLKVFFVMH
jgi:hypothetical protein